MPSHWAGAYACWGLENREAALRMVTGSAGSSAWAANLEVKCFDLTANPYLVLAALLAAGRPVSTQGATLPEPIDVDPAVLDEAALASVASPGLPQDLRTATDAFADRLGAGRRLRPGLGRVGRRAAGERARALRRRQRRGPHRSHPLAALNGRAPAAKPRSPAQVATRLHPTPVETRMIPPVRPTRRCPLCRRGRHVIHSKPGLRPWVGASPTPGTVIVRAATPSQGSSRARSQERRLVHSAGRPCDGRGRARGRQRRLCRAPGSRAAHGRRRCWASRLTLARHRRPLAARHEQ